jgi:hypothetical protein
VVNNLQAKVLLLSSKNKLRGFRKFPGSVGNVLKELIAEDISYFRFSGVSDATLNGHSSYITGREFSFFFSCNTPNFVVQVRR